MTRSEALKLVAVLRAAFPNWRATAETEDVWAGFLSDLDYAAANRAVSRLVLGSAREFPPPIGAIRAEVAREVAPELGVSPEEAWGEVLAEIRRVGWCGRPTWSSGELAQAVQAIGWRELCLSEEGDTGIRAHFFRTFGAYQARARETAATPERLRVAALTRPLALVR